MSYRHWTDEELEQLRRMYLDGAKGVEIAAALGRTMATTCRALSQYSISSSEHYQMIRKAAIDARREKERVGR